MSTTPDNISADDAHMLIAQQSTLSALMAQPNSELLVPQMSNEALKRFTLLLDDAEINRIWNAAATMSAWREYDFITFVFAKSTPYGRTEWRCLSQALINHSASMYVDWFKRGIRREQVGYSDTSRFASIKDFALGEILEAADAVTVTALARWILTEAPSATRLRMLNVLATSKHKEGLAHPLEALKVSDGEELSSFLSGWWEEWLNRAIGKGSSTWRNLLKSSSYEVPESISFLAENCDDFFVLPIGYFTGILAETPEKIDSVLADLKIRKNAAAFVPMATVWHLLMRISDYVQSYGDHEIELLGLRQVLLDHAQNHPDTWTRALRWMMLHCEYRGIKSDIVGITCQLGKIATPELALLTVDENPDIAALAQGIHALLRGGEDPSGAHIAYLADSLAHYRDGTPKFPSPLSIRSGTWISSQSLESDLSDGVKRANGFFDIHLREHKGSVEEALTATLLNEIMVQFRTAAARSDAFGTPRLKLAQREISKNQEEHIYGCDLAFLVKAQAPGVYLMEWTDLVQVKKSVAMSKADATALTPDSWTIDIVQLGKIIKYSATAVYFLFCAQGGVLVVPAKYLMGFVDGKPGAVRNATRTLGYNAIRSAAIPLEQYLVNLLIGLWVGTTSQDTMDFVKGNNQIRPRTVIDVTIEFAAPRG
jgi:hypothetical protein